MRCRILCILVLMLPINGWATHATGNDDSDTATQNASCNASFQAGCPTEATIAYEAVAAPIGPIGGGVIETLALLAFLGGALKSRIARRRVD